MPFKVGVSTGLYSVARAEEIATSVRKIGYTLTRGTSAIEVSGDVPHEVTETVGKEMVYIADKQKLDLLFHGSLTVPMCMPERGEWRDAHEHITKSVKSAILSGCKYVNFHSCLQVWLELITYAGRKLTMSFCDHQGRFISHILKSSEKLRNWFVKNKWSDYAGDILTRKESNEASTEARIQMESELREATEELRDLAKKGKINQDEFEKRKRKLSNKYAREESTWVERNFRKIIRKKLKKYPKERWDSEELRSAVGVLDGYHIMANYMFFKQDSMWKEMSKFYESTLKKYDLDPNDIDSLDNAWKKAEDNNDKKFKEFYYGVVGAKFLEGHMKRLLDWMKKELPKDLDKLPERTKDQIKYKKLVKKAARNIQITIETPDARDASHAGMHLLWEPRQVYVAVKTLRKTLDTDRIWLLMDFEHVATQGVDPIKVMNEIVGLAEDYGQYVISVHSNAPNPLHAHEPLELGDIRIYRLLHMLRKTGFGKNRLGYLIFERGGGKDPFKKSIEALRLAAKSLEKDIEPDNLPPEYFGMKGPVAGDYIRQEQIVKQHAFEPIKDLLEMPEEEWTMLSQTAVKKGKGEQFKKEELR